MYGGMLECKTCPRSPRIVPIVQAAGTRSGVRFGSIRPQRLKLAGDFHAPLRDEDLIGA